MPETLRHEFQILARFEQHCRMGMAERMERKPLAELLHELIERTYGSQTDKRPVQITANQIIILIILAVEQLCLRLPCVRGFQYLLQRITVGDRAVTA